MRNLIAISLLLHASLLSAAPPPSAIFVRTEQPSRPQLVYREGWLDLNKNGVRDPYEDSALGEEAP